MATLLVIDSSARHARSHTRHLTQLFVRHWRTLCPEAEVLHRDVGAAPPPPVDAAWVAASFTSPAERTADMRRALAVSDALIAEVERADVLLLGAPMYNFGMPAQLKAWVDQVVRVGRTFSFDPARPADPYRPLLAGKSVVLVTSRGDRGFDPGGPLAHLNHLDAHLATVCGFIGITHVATVAVESDEWADAHLAHSRAAAERAIERLVRELGVAPRAVAGTAP